MKWAIKDRGMYFQKRAARELHFDNDVAKAKLYTSAKRACAGLSSIRRYAMLPMAEIVEVTP